MYFDGCVIVHLIVGPVMAEAMFVNREEIPVYPIYRDPVSSHLRNHMSCYCCILFICIYILVTSTA